MAASSLAKEGCDAISTSRSDKLGRQTQTHGEGGGWGGGCLSLVSPKALSSFTREGCTGCTAPDTTSHLRVWKSCKLKRGKFEPGRAQAGGLLTKVNGCDSNNSTETNVSTLSEPEPGGMTPTLCCQPRNTTQIKSIINSLCFLAQWIMNSIFPDNESFHKGVTPLPLSGK